MRNAVYKAYMTIAKNLPALKSGEKMMNIDILNNILNHAQSHNMLLFIPLFVEYIIDLLSQLLANTLYSCQVVNPCSGNFLKATEVFKQLLATFLANAANLLQWRMVAYSCPSGTMPSNCKPMRFIPHLLNQVQSWRICRQF